MKFDEIQERLDDLISNPILTPTRTLPDVSEELSELKCLLRETITTTMKMMRELAEVQSLHNTVLETYRVKLERLEHLEPYGGKHDA